MEKRKLVFDYFVYAACVFVLSVCFISCDDEQIVDMKVDTATLTTRAVPTPLMDWENLDWMPTPQGQSRIPSPWSGQGSLVPTYGIDIANDRKASDGWVLLYNTFDADAPGALINPYFILYNKYRGIMRIYLYVTTSFITPSSYIQDKVAINSNYSSSLFNFLGQDVIDVTEKITQQYAQIQPAPLDGSSSFVSNRWYMMQYELAYDSNIANIPYDQIQLSWTMNFYKISSVSLGGDVVGKLNGIIGQGSDPNFFSELGNVGKTVGTGVLAGVSKDFLTHNTINAETGENRLGLSKGIFKGLTKGIDAALSGAAGDLPGAAIKLLSAIFGGGSTSTPISFDLKAEIKLEGTSSEQGGFPSTPTSFWMPGTTITSSATNYIPAYNKALGVINIVGTDCPVIETIETINKYDGEDPWDGHQYTNTYGSLAFPTQFDYSEFLKINPEVLKIANVTVKQEILVFRNGNQYLDINPDTYYWQDVYNEQGAPFEPNLPEPHISQVLLRFIIKVQPKDGSPAVTIVKTTVPKVPCTHIQNW